jgi:hypothetical protein
MTRSYAYGSTNRLPIFYGDKIHNNLCNNLEILNIQFCEGNISKEKPQNCSWDDNFKNKIQFLHIKV